MSGDGNDQALTGQAAALAGAFRQIIEQAPDAIWITDGQRLVFVNPATVRLLGYDSEREMLALSPAEIVHPDDRQAMGERSMQMIRTGQSLPPRPYRVRHRSGAWVDTEVHSMPIWWQGVPAILGFARDITDRKAMEARLVRNDRLTALGTLLAGIAHEMNNPLAFALLGIEQARSVASEPGIPGELAERLGPLLADVEAGLSRVAAVVKQLRVSARPDDNRAERVELRGVLESALRMAGNELRHRARLITDLADTAPVMGSRQRFEQVFLNLLVNASQALPEGGPGNEVRVVMRSEGDSAVVEVSDNGVGIPAESLSRVFDPFFTTKPAGLGMGLGLSICHNTITAAGGHITVESDPRRGTVFRVRLPAAPTLADSRPPATAAPSTPAPPTRTARRSVLVVDDEAPLCQMVRRMLAEACEVDIVCDARQALTLLTDGGRSYDVILCDLMMPGMTGMELFEQVRSRRPDLSERFVFMSGGVFTAGANAFLSRGKAPLLEKPFDRRSLEIAVGCATS